MVAIINIDTLKVKEQIETNEVENWQTLRKSSLNSKFTGSYKKKGVSR